MIDCLEKDRQAGGGYGLQSQRQHQHQATNGIHFETQSASYQLQRQPTLIEVSSSDGQLQQQQQLQQADNELIGYYFGSISRETAEWILKTQGNQADGAYLLRSSGPNDDFVLSLMVNHNQQQPINSSSNLEVLHYKIVETEDSFVALHGQVGDEKFATIDELIDQAQGVATKPRWPIHRQYLESQILPPTYWGLTVDQIRLAILIKAKQWGFPLLSALFQMPQQQSGELQSSSNVESSNVTTPTSTTTLNNETIRTLIYKSLHEFQPWFHGKISRDEAERRIEEGHLRDGRFLVRERDNYSYAMCISHKKTTKHYRIDVLPTGELAIQDGRKFTSLMALVSHYTIMSDGLWCALTEACPRPIHSQVTGRQMTNLANNGGPTMVQQQQQQHQQSAYSTAINTLRSYPPQNGQQQQNSMYYTAPPTGLINGSHNMILSSPGSSVATSMIQSTMVPQPPPPLPMANENIMPTTSYGKSKTTSDGQTGGAGNRDNNNSNNRTSLICAQQGSAASLRGPIKEWLQTINHKWSQLMAAKNQHQSLNSFLFGNQNPLNNHCRHHHHMSPHHHHHHRRKCKNGHVACACIHHQQQMIMAAANCKLGRANDVTLARQPFMNLGNQLQIGGGSGGGLTSTSAASGRLSDFSSTTNNNSNSSNAGTIGKYQLGAGEVHGGACCQAAICPTTIYRDNLMPKNHQRHVAQAGFQAASSSSFDSTTPHLATSSSLLSCLPQNSGFALNSQSFIGSPLFAVRSTTQQQQLANGQQLGEPQAGHHRSGSSNSGSGSGNNLDGEEEVKLISPVQSISAKLTKLSSATATNNPYNLNQDIYGSQTSTALISDKHLRRLATSSSSSSEGKTATLMNQQQPGSTRFNATCGLVAHSQKGLVAGASRSATSHHSQQQQQQQQQYNPPMPLPQTRVAGPILCGQHVGPAYRYTNCSGLGDENTFKPCLHHHHQLSDLDRAGLRAADDSHLLTSSTQLAGPAAMAKFVQFQDGHCLRTHRDTRSIQQAYLSSRQQHQLMADSNNGNNNNNNNLAWNKNPVPPTKDFLNAAALQHNQFHLATKNNAPPQVPVTGGYCGAGALLVAGNNNAVQQQFGKQFNHQHQQSQHQPQQPLQSSASGVMGPVNDEIDLMDCGDGGGFNFKYDPKLIKSSSIETLCGVGVDDEDDEDDEINFDAFKTNSELIMSLQSCWFTNTDVDGQHQTVSSMLSPTPASLANGPQQANSSVEQQGNGITGINNGNNQHASRQDVSILSSLIRAGGDQHHQQDEGHESDHMKKKHDLDELTTALLAELTASLKAQVDLKNKRSGFGVGAASGSNPCQTGAVTSLHHLSDKSAGAENNHQQWSKQQQHEERVNSEVNQLELINEFDTLLPNNNR